MTLPRDTELTTNRGRLFNIAGQVTKFGAVGILNTAIDFAVFSLLHFAIGVPYLFANVASYSCGIINSFLINKHWTFGATCHSGHVPTQFIAFVCFNGVGVALSTVILAILAPMMPVVAAKGVAVGITLVWNFFTSRYLLYQRERSEQRPGFVTRKAAPKLTPKQQA